MPPNCRLHRYLPLVLLLTLAAPVSLATTIYRCDIGGIPSFQDTPCPDQQAEAAADPRVRLLQQRRDRLLQRRQALRAELKALAPPGDGNDEAKTQPLDYAAQADRQRQQWQDRALAARTRQQLAELEDNLRLLEARLQRLGAAP